MRTFQEQKSTSARGRSRRPQQAINAGPSRAYVRAGPSGRLDCRPSCGRCRPRTIARPSRSDHPAVLDDRIVHWPPDAVRDQDARGAVPARDRAFRPGPQRGLLDVVEFEDFQVGVPEPAFLGAKPRLDRVQRKVGVAGRQSRIVAWADQVTALLPRTGGAGRRPAAATSSAAANRWRDSRTPVRQTPTPMPPSHARLSPCTGDAPSATASLAQLYCGCGGSLQILSQGKPCPRWRSWTWPHNLDGSDLRDHVAAHAP